MNSPRIGELFAGYGGLGMGVQAALGGEIAWYSEIDKGALKILTHRFPDVPNIGDITTVDWSQVEPVDILTGGSPCQDLSHAGKRAGMTEGTRSNLWVAMREAIAQLRPSMVVWENVRGAYSAEADSDLVNDPRLLADTRRRDGEPVLRALGRVLGDLSELGYVGGWHGLRAADVGAPHGRFRVFVVAWDASRDDLWHGAVNGGGRARGAQQQARGADRDPGALLPTPAAYDGDRGGPQDPEKRRAGGHSVTLQDAVHVLPTPTARDWKNVGDPDKTAARMAERGQPLGEVVVNALLPTPRAGDGEKCGPNQRGSSGDLMLPSAVTHLLPTPAAQEPGGTPEQYHARLAAHDGRESTFLPLSMAVQMIGDADAISAEDRPRQELRGMRNAADPQAVREWSTRGSDGLPQEEVLLPELREQEDGDHSLGASVPGEAASEVGVRGVRRDEPPARSPQGPQLAERRPIEPANAVCLMPSQAPLAGGPRGACGCGTSWGQYEAAIRRWEQVLGRCAPPPTETGPKGNPRLSAAFSEFLMGLPAGWVTDVPGITRNEALKALGNGVVPQQAEAAVRFLIDHLARSAA
jgi:DNA (cytosine-5)-methyltransferase 1